MPPTVADLQRKILEKVEQKKKAGVTRASLTGIFEPCDRDHDGQLSQVEFGLALEQIGNPLDNNELAFVFEFWDCMAGQRDRTGCVEVDLIVSDLLASQPQYDTGFNSGAETLKTNKGAKGNLPSQAGGIFGGGSYEADSRNELPTPNRQPTGAPNPGYAAAAAQQSGRPKGNQSSIPGGIFGGGDDAAPPPPSAAAGGRSNRSNQSSIPGGIFGEAQQQSARQGGHRCNSNASSIPGGIFG